MHWHCESEAKVAIRHKGLLRALPPLALASNCPLLHLCLHWLHIFPPSPAPFPRPLHPRSPLLAQCFVYGDSLKAQLVAIVVPDAEVLVPWAKERGMSGSLTQLIADPAVQAAIMKSMQEEGREAKLRGFEQVWGRERGKGGIVG